MTVAPRHHRLLRNGPRLLPPQLIASITLLHFTLQGDDLDGERNLIAIPLDLDLWVTPVDADEIDHDYDQLWPEEEEVGVCNINFRAVASFQAYHSKHLRTCLLHHRR